LIQACQLTARELQSRLPLTYRQRLSSFFEILDWYILEVRRSQKDWKAGVVVIVGVLASRFRQGVNVISLIQSLTPKRGVTLPHIRCNQIVINHGLLVHGLITKQFTIFEFS